MGDFNGERSLDAAKETLRKYPLYRKLSDPKKQLFLQFYRSVHDYLLEHGYVPLYTERLVGGTNRFGGVSDWIYVKYDLDVSVETVTSVNALQCSDHIRPLLSWQITGWQAMQSWCTCGSGESNYRTTNPSEESRVKTDRRGRRLRNMSLTPRRKKPSCAHNPKLQ